jgi:alkylation response protein AidB-like acyl-CoA dehydrogenase
VLRVAQDAMYVIGGLSYFKRIPLERMYRDVISMPFHPRSFEDAKEALGKSAWGLRSTQSLDGAESRDQDF